MSRAGGLGMIPNPTSAAEVVELLGRARALTDGSVGVGFLVPFLRRDAVEAAALHADVVEFFYGDPDLDLVRIASGGDAVVGWQVGSAAEAVAAIRAGCRFVVVQGVEAGGHIRGTEALDQVLAETLARVEVPVVAAGGVGTADRAAQLLSGGASAVRVGTRFIAAKESNAHPLYIRKLIAAGAGDTVISETFAVGWPDAPHRVLRSAVDAAVELDAGAAVSIGGRSIPPLAAQPPSRDADGRVEAMALYAGRSVDAVSRVQPAAEIVVEITSAIVQRGRG